jgi:signal transduction histidine kinase/streptogramin lyase
VLLVLAPGAGAERQFTALGAGRGLTAATVHAMLIDRDGMLWVGAREGLYRYDGYQATEYRPDSTDPGSLSDVEVRGLYQADDGALWVATLGGGVNRRDPRTGRFTQFRHDPADPRSLSDPSAFSIAEDREGNLWIATTNGLNRLDSDQRGFIRYRHEPGRAASLAHDRLSKVHVGPSGRLWIATLGAGVDRWDPGSDGFEHFSLAQLVGGSPGLDLVFSIQEASDGRLWVGTRDGLLLLDPLRREAALVKLARDGDPEPFVAALHVDRLGRLWIGTLSQGLMVAEQPTGDWPRVARLEPVSVGGSIGAQQTLVIVSNHDSLLAGTWGAGVFRAPLEVLNATLLTRSADGSGLRSKSVTAVLGGSPAGQPWVGSQSGGPERVDVTTGTVVVSGGSASDGLSRANVLSLAVTQDGTHFAGTPMGLYRFARSGSSLGFDAYVAGNATGIGAGYVRALLPAGARGLWVGASRSGLWLRDPGSGRYSGFSDDRDPRDQRSDDYITALAAAAEGRLWIGTRAEGLRRCRVEPWSCERIAEPTSERPGMGRHYVTALRRDRAGALWIATDGGGLHRLHEGDDGEVLGFERWGEEHGLLSDGIMSVEDDTDGSLWLGTRQGLSRLDPATGRVANLIPASGLPASTFNAGASSADADYLYFGSTEGLVSVPKGQPLQTRPTAPVRITAVHRLAGGTRVPLQPADIAEGFKLRSGDTLALEFAVLDLVESRHEYAYRIDEEPWLPLGEDRQVSFAGLAPGRHRLEVRGRDAFGQWGTSPPLAFEVIPPLWMTGWFRLLAIGTSVLLLLGLHRMRLRGLRRRNAELKQLQAQREQALERAESGQRVLAEAYAGLRQLTARLESAEEEERRRISRELHDEFGQTLTAAKINLQMLHRGTADAVAARRLEDSVNMVERMIRQTRDIARGLRPTLLDEVGLVPALEQHVEILARRSDVRIEVDARDSVADLPPGLKTTVFRIVQEALNNALRHARATRIRVTLRDEPDALQFVIEDDGVGFDAEAVSQRIRRGEHLGLLGMAERVHNAGGTIKLDARPGAGSRIEVRIPLAGAVSAAEAPSRTRP